ncbi:MAG: alpha/beta hydrolase [Atopobiaceae bacterium]|nr:alpha/beta hydrolase [Atopobiaceae bacterium]
MQAEELFSHDRELTCHSEQGAIYTTVWLPDAADLTGETSHGKAVSARGETAPTNGSGEAGSAHGETALTDVSAEAPTHVTAEASAHGTAEAPADTAAASNDALADVAAAALDGAKPSFHDTKPPLVIFCHELGLDHRSAAPWARQLVAHGWAVASFDFCGGSIKPNKSDGSSRNMSVMTEVADLEAVSSEAATWDFVDTNRIVLMGASQGGIVAALTAHAHPEQVAALVLLYPAFSVSDGMRRLCPDPSTVPDEFDLLGWMPVGKRYVTDMWHYEPFEHLDGYEGPTLIIHGVDDPIVDVSYSRRAADVYHDCELYELSGEGHGFTNKAFKKASQIITGFLISRAG